MSWLPRKAVEDRREKKRRRTLWCGHVELDSS
jgi:hypothetical protein